MIWIIGGTSETGQFLKKIRGRVKYIVTVATESGREVLGDDAHVMVARLDPRRMQTFIHDHAITTVVDVTHPYATEVSRNARQVCQEANIPYRRYLRETSDRKGALCVRSIEECATFLKTITGCVFFTTGSKNIPDFQKVRGRNRFIYRVLPTPASLAICHQNHVALKDIVAMLGPISEALNIAMFQEYHAEYVVMKDSGKTGGTPQKISACRKLGITSVLICRKGEEGVSDLDVLAEMICRKS